MAIKQIVQDQSATFEVYPRTRPSSATVEFKKPGGSALVASASASVDSTSTTIASVSATSQKYALTDSSGVVSGRKYFIIGADGGESLVDISEIDSATDTITISTPSAVAVVAGDVFAGARISATLADSKTATRDLFYQADWTITPSSGDVIAIQQPFHICRMVFRDPVTADDVKKTLAYQWTSAVSRYEIGELENIAHRASQMVFRQIEATGRFPHLYGDPDAFKDAGLAALRLVLADQGLIPNPNTTDALEYIDAMTRKMKEEVRTATASAQWYDADDDGIVDDRETGPWSTRVRL